MAAPTSSTGRPSTSRPSNFVSSTDTSTGTRKMRAIVREFGRFIPRAPFYTMILSTFAALRVRSFG